MLPQMQLHVNVTPMTFSDSIAPNTSYRKGTTFGIKRKIIGGISSKIKGPARFLLQGLSYC